VAGAVNVSVVTVRRFVLNVRGADGDTTCFFFRGVVDLRVIARFAAVCLGQNRADCSGQSGFTVVNVTDSTDVDVRFSPFKLTFAMIYPNYVLQENKKIVEQPAIGRADIAITYRER